MINHKDFAQIKRLSIFAVVVEQGSFAGAAKVLGLSRPAVSEQISLLEKQLSARLLHRTTRKLTLTTDGDDLYPYAHAINQTYISAKKSLDDGQLAGKVRLTTTVDFAVDWLIPKLQTFQQRHPNIDIDIIASDNTLDLVKEQIDLGIRIGVPKDEQLIARPLFKQSLSIFASSDYLQNNPMPKRLQEAEQHQWLLLPQLYSKQRIDVWSGDKKGVIEPKRVWQSNSPAVLMAQMKAGLGLSMAFPMIIKQSIAQGELVQVLQEWRSEELTFALIYASRKNMPARVKALRDYLLADS